MGVRRRRNTELRLSGVVDGVEPLQEGQTVDEVHARARRGTDVSDDEVDGVGVTADRRVQLVRENQCWTTSNRYAGTYCARPDLCIRFQFELSLREG